MSFARPTPVSHIRYVYPCHNCNPSKQFAVFQSKPQPHQHPSRHQQKMRGTPIHGQLNGENDDEPAYLGTEFNTPLAPIGELENASLSRLRVFLWQSHQGLNLNVVKTMTKSLESSKALDLSCLIADLPPAAPGRRFFGRAAVSTRTPTAEKRQSRRQRKRHSRPSTQQMFGDCNYSSFLGGLS